MKVYILEAPHTTLAVATDLDRARRWRDEIREHEDAPCVTIYEMIVDDPPGGTDG